MDWKRWFRRTGFPYRLTLLAGLVGLGIGLLVGTVIGVDDLFVPAMVGAVAVQVVWEAVWVRRRHRRTDQGGWPT
jgi:hypothetical protein